MNTWDLSPVYSLTWMHLGGGDQPLCAGHCALIILKTVAMIAPNPYCFTLYNFFFFATWGISIFKLLKIHSPKDHKNNMIEKKFVKIEP